MRILVTNDDGVFADGLRHLVAAASTYAEVIVVAPDREQSAMSHALTLHRPLRLRRVEEHWYAVDGTPTDCVNLAVQGILKEDPPDLVVSGINYGVNMGEDVTYSGTVSAAFEASLLRLPAIAVSQDVRDGFSFTEAEERVRELLGALLAEGLPPGLLLNVNLPAGPCLGVEVTRLGRRFYHQTVVEKTDPKGRLYYWIAGTPEWEEDEGTDYVAVAGGRISVTPLHLDLTDYRAFDRFAPLAARLGERVGAAGS